MFPPGLRLCGCLITCITSSPLLPLPAEYLSRRDTSFCVTFLLRDLPWLSIAFTAKSQFLPRASVAFFCLYCLPLVTLHVLPTHESNCSRPNTMLYLDSFTFVLMCPLPAYSTFKTEIRSHLWEALTVIPIPYLVQYLLSFPHPLCSLNSCMCRLVILIAYVLVSIDREPLKERLCCIWLWVSSLQFKVMHKIDSQ